MKSGWKTKTLGEVCSFLNRGISPRYLERGGICVINQKCVRDHHVSYEPSRRHDAQAKKVGSDRLIQAGDVLVNSTGTGTLGRVAQLREAPPEPTTVDSHVTIVRPTPGKFYPEFFGYMLVVIEDAIKEAGEGCGGQTELARSVLAKKFPVHYPESLPEQRRIVGILDEAFGGIATAKANAEKNRHNARALFESHLQSVFTQHGKGWEEKRLGEVADSISTGPFGTMLHKSDYVPDGIPLVNPMNIVDSRIVPSGKMMVNEKTRKRLSGYVLKAGDIVIGRRGELGRCALVTDREEGWLCGTGSFFVRLSDCMDGKFFVALFGSQQFKARLEGSAVGTTMSSLNHGILNDLRLPVPPIAVQRKAMAKADDLLAETQRLESIYKQKLAALEALKKSLLHRAFNGELIKDNGQ